MRNYLGAFAALVLVFVIGPAATGAGGPPQGTQDDGTFSSSYASSSVTSVSATTKRTSC